MKTLWKLFQTLVIIGMAAVMGWYSFLYLEWIGIITAAYFTAIGWMLSQVWASEKKKSEPTSDVRSSNIIADVVSNTTDDQMIQD